MSKWPVIALGLFAIASISCQKSNFKESGMTAETIDVKVVDPSSDATATVNQEYGSGAGTGDGTAMPQGEESSPGSSSTSDDDSSTETESGTSTTTVGKEKKNGSSSSASGSSEASECASIAGISAQKVKISGSQKQVTLSPQEAFALKVTGNENKVHLKLSSDSPGMKLPAICLFASGNQSHITLDIGITVGHIYIKARGNKTLVEAEVQKDGVVEKLDVDAKGNQPSIQFRGEGKFPL